MGDSGTDGVTIPKARIMLESLFVQQVIVYLQVNPLIAALMGGLGILFLIGLIRKLVKMAIVTALILCAGSYYITQAAPAFWQGLPDQVASGIIGSGKEVLEHGKQVLEQVTEKGIEQAAEELKEELKKRGQELTE